MPKKIDPTGQVFGRLTVIAYAGRSTSLKSLWHCRCDCGQTTTTNIENLRHGTTQSCGCLKRERWLKARTRHGLSKTPEYVLWKHIIQRCENPSAADYARYGGRGIRIAAYWRDDFPTFRADLLATIGPKPDGYHSLDRIDNNGHYERGNVRWSLPLVQMNNQRKTRHLTLNGETHTIREWSERLNMPLATIAARKSAGWTDERALSRPAEHYQPVRTLTYKGRTMTLREWAEDTGLPLSALIKRVEAGWSVHRTLTEPRRKQSAPDSTS